MVEAKRIKSDFTGPAYLSPVIKLSALLRYGKYISIDVERTPPVFANIYLATMSNGMPSGNIAKPHFIMQFNHVGLINHCLLTN